MRCVAALVPLPLQSWQSFRDKWSEGEIHYRLKRAQTLIGNWRELCNTLYPHSSPGYRPPNPGGRAHHAGDSRSLILASTLPKSLVLCNRVATQSPAFGKVGIATDHLWL